MKHFLAILLLFGLILQPLSKFLIVSNYALNTKSITAKYCVNKAKPKLKCNGKCHLKKQLILHDKQSNQDKDNSKEVNSFNWYTSASEKAWLPLVSNTISLNFNYLGQESDPFLLSLFRPPTC